MEAIDLIPNDATVVDVILVRLVRAAYLSLPTSELPPKLEAFVNDAVMEKVRALEVERNGGEPLIVSDARVSPGRKPQV